MKKEILIIDDSEFMRKQIKDILEMNGYTVVGDAQSSIEGLELYKSLKPDLVTMDIVMFGPNGLEGAKSILDYDREARVLIVSAMGQQQLIIEAIKLGTKGFVLKPFKPHELISEVKRILGD